MIKKMIFGTVLGLGLIFATTQNCFAQAKTQDELKAEREVLKAEMKSKEALDRKAKLEKMTVPKPTNINSIDVLARSTANLLVTEKNINTLLPEMYKRTVGESVDGITDVTVTKPSLDELKALATNIAVQIKSVADISSTIPKASEDIKSASLFQAPAALKSLNFSKDALVLLAPELQLNLKVVNNLIATLLSSKNL
jgi:hypothetical protein